MCVISVCLSLSLQLVLHYCTCMSIPLTVFCHFSRSTSALVCTSHPDSLLPYHCSFFCPFLFSTSLFFFFFSFFFFFNDPATTEIYTLSLHDALPIYLCSCSNLPAEVKNSGTTFATILNAAL